MNKREQEQFAAFFEEVYEAEEVLDFIKQQLAAAPSFSPHLLFDFVAAGQQHISLQRMRSFLEERVAANPRELY